MSEDPTNLRQMLEQATAPGSDSPVDLDAETAALRKGWIGLGKLLEAEQRPSARTVEKRAEVPAGDRVELANPGSQRKAPTRSFRVAAVLAASLLIVAGATYAIHMLNGTDDRQPNPPQIAKDDVPSAKGSREQAAIPAPKTVPSASTDRQIAATGDRLQWGDSVDDDITAVGRQTALARQDWYSQAGAVGVIQTGIDDLQKEMDQGSL